MGSKKKAQPPSSDEVEEEQDNAMDGATTSATSSRRGSWSLPEDLSLLALFKEVVSNYDRINSDDWEMLLKRYNEKNSLVKVDKDQLRCRFKTLKRGWALNRELRSKRGLAWDDARHMAVVPDDRTWDELLVFNKQYKKVKNKPFPQYEALDQIFGGQEQDLLEEPRESSLSSKEEADRVENDTGVLSVSRPQMPQAIAHTQQQIPMYFSPTPISSSGRKRSRNKSASAKHEKSPHGDHYIPHSEPWKLELREVYKKIKSVPGSSAAQRIAGMEACRDPTTREMVKIFDSDDLKYWLEKLEPRSPELIASDPPTCSFDLAEVCTHTVL